MTIAKGAQPIATLEDWERLAGPKAKIHWADGRSAKEVARAWLASSPQMPAEVVDILAPDPHFGPVLSWDCEPEAKLRFDDFGGEPRNTDLCVAATDAHGPYVLAVEAKADEPYGETVADTFAAALERCINNPRSNGVARIAALARMLFAPGGDSGSAAAALRYQLLTACAGAVAEAERRQTCRAIMLVQEFVTSRTKDDNHVRNAEDLRLFLCRLNGRRIERVEDGRLYGPFSPPGGPGIDLFVGKVKRNLRPAGKG